MATVWPVVYYRDQTGHQPVSDAIDSLVPRDQAIVDNHVERLAMFGPALPYPWSSQVDGSMRELRADAGPVHYRILYRRSANLFVLLHFVHKRAARLDRADIEIANER
jgi:phage-related protein